MNIYIYGSQNFKKEIHEELSKSNIDYKLGENGLIQDVTSLDTLKQLIEDNDDDVFLIDDAKIIKENLINQKIKFLKPKDGIEQNYLKEKGIEDLSVDSISGVSKHILKKMKELGLDSDDDFIERSEIEDSISNIVKDAYNEEDKEEHKDEEYFEENEDDFDDKYELSEDLRELLSSSDDIDSLVEDTLVEEEIDNKEINYDEKDDNMANLVKGEDFFSLDDLNENDILSAFSGSDTFTSTPSKKESKEVSLKLDNPEDIKEFLAKLLESKALEITVKIKE